MEVLTAKVLVFIREQTGNRKEMLSVYVYGRKGFVSKELIWGHFPYHPSFLLMHFWWSL